MSKRKFKTFKILLAGVLLLATQIASASVVGYWMLDGDASATIGTSGTLVGSPTAGLDRNGVAGGALDFNQATLDHVTIAGGGGLDGSALGTLSAWVKWNGAGQDIGHSNHFGSVIARQADGLWSDPILGLTGADPNTALIGYSNAATAPLVTSAASPGNGWNHVAVRWWGSGSELLLNGVSQGVSAAGGTREVGAAIPLTLGAWIGAGASYSNSSLDDIAVFDDYLSDTQIADLAAQNVTPLSVGTGTVGPPPPPSPILPITATASSHYTPDNRAPITAVNGAGLIGNAHNTTPSNSMWLSNGVTAGTTFTVDLGAVYTVDEMKFWNYNESHPSVTWLRERGIQSADLLISDNGVDYTTHIAGQTFAIAPATQTDFSELISLGGVKTRYIQFANLVRHAGASPPSDQYIGISEVQFFGDLYIDPPLPNEIPATIHSVSSELLGGFDRQAAYLVDRSGLVDGGHSIDPDGSMWLNHGTFRAPNDIDPELVFDLGSVTFVQDLLIWNYNEVLPGQPERDAELLSRGVKLMDIYIAGDDEVFTLFLEDVLLDMGTGETNVDISQLISLGGVNTRFIKFDMKQNWGDVNNFYGLSEVKFLVPEPSALSILGLLAVTCVRRKSQT